MSQKKQQDTFFRGSRGARTLRMTINVITCAGAGLSAVAMVLGIQGQVREAWLLLVFSVAIDAVDGSLIRWLDVKKLCPEYDGERLDEYADLITFVIAPVGIALGTNILPNNILGIGTVLAVVGGSCLQFSYQRAKTKLAFWGFPSYWNVIFFYGWALSPDHNIMLYLSWGLVIALFLPIPFIYPSRTPRFRITTISLTIAWSVALVYYLWFPSAAIDIIYYSLFFPAYYVGLSFVNYSHLKTK